MYHMSAVAFHYKASVCKLGHHSCSFTAYSSSSYRRILGADLSSVTALRSFTPRRINASMSLSSWVAEDGSLGAHRTGSSGNELLKGKWPSPRAWALAASSPIFSTRLWRLAASRGSSSALCAAMPGACWPSTVLTDPPPPKPQAVSGRLIRFGDALM